MEYYIIIYFIIQNNRSSIAIYYRVKPEYYNGYRKSGQHKIELKRLILFFGGGLEASTIYKNKDIWPYKVVRDGDLRRIKCKTGYSFTIEEVMKDGILKLKYFFQAREDGKTISNAILIVPSFFNTSMRNAMMSAFKFHKINLIDVLNEIPTIIENGDTIFKQSLNKYILAFDTRSGEVTLYNNETREIMGVCEIFEICSFGDIIFNNILNEYLRSMTIDIESESLLDSLENLHEIISYFKSSQKIGHYRRNELNCGFKTMKIDAIFVNHEDRVIDRLRCFFKKIHIAPECVTDIIVYNFIPQHLLNVYSVNEDIIFFANLKELIPNGKLHSKDIYEVYENRPRKEVFDRIYTSCISNLTDSLNAPAPNVLIEWNVITSVNTIEWIHLQNESKVQLSSKDQNKSKNLNNIIQVTEEVEELNIQEANSEKEVKIIKQNETKIDLSIAKEIESKLSKTISELNTKLDESKIQLSSMKENESKHLRTISQLNSELDESKSQHCNTKENESKYLKTISELNSKLHETKIQLDFTKENESKHLEIISQLNAKLDEAKIKLSSMKQNESKHLNTIDELNAKFDELKIQKTNIETKLMTLEFQHSTKKLDEKKIAGIDFTQKLCKAAFVDQMQSPIWESASELEFKHEALVQMFKELKEKANIEGGVVAVDGDIANLLRRDIVLSAMILEFSVLRIVNDTTAILAANECFNDAKNRCALVLNVNYQRFQATVVRLENQRSKLILKTTTDQFTEAKFNEALLKYCCEQFHNFTNLDLLTIDSPVVEKALQQLKENALEAKERLRVLDSTRIDTGPLYCDQVLDIIFSRTTCQHIVTKFMDDIPKYIFQCLRGKDLQRHEITDVILVGDFAQFLDHMFNQNFPRANVHKTNDSNEIVAQGAAILAKAALGEPIVKFDQLIESRQVIIE